MKSHSPDAPKALTPLKILLMGPPGARKTTFGLQFPNVHVLDCDHNLDGPVGVLSKQIPSFSFTYDDIRSDDSGKGIEIHECYDRLVDKLSLFKSDKDYIARSTVFVDSLSHVNEFIIRKVMKSAGKTEMAVNLWSSFSTAAYTILVAKLDDTHKTVICSCHEENIAENDKTDLMKKQIVAVNPLFSGRVGDCIGAFFTDVWRLDKRLAPGGKVELWLQTDRTPKCEHLKNSLGMPPEVNVTAGIKAIEQYLKGRV